MDYPEVFGKKIGNDILTNKKTFLLIKALELSEGKINKELTGWLSRENFNPGEKINGMTEIFNTLEIDARHRTTIDCRPVFAPPGSNGTAATTTADCVACLGR